MVEYRELYPTCPECKNESLIITNSRGSNWFKCEYCNYQEEISIQRMRIYD